MIQASLICFVWVLLQDSAFSKVGKTQAVRVFGVFLRENSRSSKTMAKLGGRPKRYLTPTEFKVIQALFRNGVPIKTALAEIGMAKSVFDSRVRDAMSDSSVPSKELPYKRQQNVKFIFQLFVAQREHSQTLVKRLDLDDGRNVRWLLATLYPDTYSQRVAEERTLKDDSIRDYDEPSAAQQQASELLGEGDKPDVPGLDD